jgi:hypothetical protein
MVRLRLRDLAAQILRCQLRIQSTKSASSTVLIHIKLGKEERDISGIVSLTLIESLVRLRREQEHTQL